MIHMLHEMLQEPSARDPDARFRELLKAILSEHRFAALSTADFQRAIEKQMTPAMDLEGTHSMDWFFDEWVRGTGIPQLFGGISGETSRPGISRDGQADAIRRGRCFYGAGSAVRSETRAERWNAWE